MHLDKLSPCVEARLEVACGLYSSDRDQRQIGAAQAVQLFDLHAGLHLLSVILPGAVTLPCRWRPWVMRSDQAVETQLQQHFG